MRWARALLASGRAKPEEIAIAAASPAEWDDHFQALSEMAGIDLHFVHGRKALSTPEGQLAAALAEVLLRGFSQARMTRLIALLRSQNADFKIVPGNWWRDLPEDAPLLDAASWRDVLLAMSNPADPNSESVVRVLTSLTETLALGLKRAGEVGALLLRGRSLAIWERALTEGPPEALDVTLASLALPDQVAQEANIIWAPAATLAANPRSRVRLVGLTRPRMRFCQTISCLHLCLILCRCIKLIGGILTRSSRQQPDRSSARERGATHKGASTAFRPCIRECRARYTDNAPASRSTQPGGLIVCSRDPRSSRTCRRLVLRAPVGSTGTPSD
jgi:hypothetical protein